MKRESLDCKHDDMGRLIDEFGKFLFDNNGNPIEFNGEDIGYLKDLNLINILWYCSFFIISMIYISLYLCKF